MGFRIFKFILASIIVPNLYGQQSVFQTFKDTRVINTQSVETLPKGTFDFRISHRFGDMFGNDGGWPTLYGLESASDILFGLEFGITDYFTVGLHRTKGSGPLQKLVNTNFKLKVQEQNADGTSPISVAIVGMATFSTMIRSTDPEELSYFDNFLERNILNAHLLLARKFSDKFSFQITAGYTYRNIVEFEDQNALFNLGASFRLQLTRVLSIIGDWTAPLSNYRSNENGFYNPVGIGFEFDTGGHVFQLNFTNSRGILETDYIPYTFSNFREGQFRLGFTISRRFNI